MRLGILVGANIHTSPHSHTHNAKALGWFKCVHFYHSASPDKCSSATFSIQYLEFALPTLWLFIYFDRKYSLFSAMNHKQSHRHRLLLLLLLTQPMNINSLGEGRRNVCLPFGRGAGSIVDRITNNTRLCWFCIDWMLKNSDKFEMWEEKWNIFHLICCCHEILFQGENIRNGNIAVKRMSLFVVSTWRERKKLTQPMWIFPFDFTFHRNNSFNARNTLYYLPRESKRFTYLWHIYLRVILMQT